MNIVEYPHGFDLQIVIRRFSNATEKMQGDVRPYVKQGYMLYITDGDGAVVHTKQLGMAAQVIPRDEQALAEEIAEEITKNLAKEFLGALRAALAKEPSGFGVPEP